jgi:glycosyltransferase involved in cell wall biosynthesis
MNHFGKSFLISIIIPLYNKEKEVLRAINSVLSQTVSDFEVIVVNDGSTDNGPEIVKSINDHRIRVIDQANAGVSAARNRGIEESRAELIAFLDADDEWSPDFLETIMGLKRDFPECSVFATSYFLVSQDGMKRPAIVRGLPEGFQKGILKDYFIIAAQSDPPLWTSATAVKKTAISIVGGFPVGIVSGEDLLTWARLAVKYDISYTIEPKAIFWQPIDLADRPERMPNEPDLVGDELKKLKNICNKADCNGLREYIGLWHKNRTSIYIRRGEKLKALKEIMKAISITGINQKSLMYLIGAMLPKALATNMMAFIKHRMYKY